MRSKVLRILLDSQPDGQESLILILTYWAYDFIYMLFFFSFFQCVSALINAPGGLARELVDEVSRTKETAL